MTVKIPGFYVQDSKGFFHEMKWLYEPDTLDHQTSEKILPPQFNILAPLIDHFRNLNTGMAA